MERDWVHESYILEDVVEFEDRYELKFNSGTSLGLSKEHGVVPKKGNTVELYGGFGHPVRGVIIDGKVAYYRTPEEEQERHKAWVFEKNKKDKEEFEKNKEKLNAQYDALPEVFQKRLDKFRTNNPDFRWEYESYEMFTCTQAVAIAESFKNTEEIEKWYDMDWDEQKKMVPELSDQHSGNTFGMAVKLAMFYLDCPENVIKLHGALAPLVGSAEYGCIPRTEEEEK